MSPVGDQRRVNRARLSTPPRKWVTTSAPMHPRRLRCSASEYGEYAFGRAPCRTGRLGADPGRNFRGAVLRGRATTTSRFSAA